MVMDHKASAMPALALGKVLSISDCDRGIMGPATAPCSTRKATSDSRDQANPHSHDEMTNSMTETTNRCTWPKRWVSQPVRGTVMALATANEVMTHVPCVALTPRSPAMVGIETLAI